MLLKSVCTKNQEQERCPFSLLLSDFSLFLAGSDNQDEKGMRADMRGATSTPMEGWKGKEDVVCIPWNEPVFPKEILPLVTAQNLPEELRETLSPRMRKAAGFRSDSVSVSDQAKLTGPGSGMGAVRAGGGGRQNEGAKHGIHSCTGKTF